MVRIMPNLNPTTRRRRRRHRNTWQAFLSVAQEGGVRALWRGWAPNCQRAALVQLGDLTTYDLVKHVRSVPPVCRGCFIP